MRSLQYKMPEGNPTLFSSLLVYENTLICGVCHQEKSRFLFHQRVNRIGVNRQYRDHGPLCKECASKGKHCSACGIYKVFAEFPKGTNRGQRFAYCFLCKRKRNKREYTPEAGRARNMRSHHGITLEQYQAMFEAQNGVCAICGKPETARDKTGKIQPLSVDHDHETGMNRALLCNKCNVFLGKIECNINLVEKMFAYRLLYKSK